MPRMKDGITSAEALEMKRAAERSLAKRGFSSGRYAKKRKRTTQAALIVVARSGLVGVLEMFPAALHLRTLGYRVFIRCDESWHDIFECIDYAEPDIGIHSYNKIYDPSRAWRTATTAKRNNWRAFIYQRFADDFGAWNNPTLTRLPNPRITSGEYCFMFGESVSRNVHFRLRFLPWLIAHAKSVEFAEPRGSDVGALLYAATRSLI